MSVINTNITSMIGQSNLNKSQNALQTSMERLSSGLRINSAKDDSAGQAIANRMTAQITGLNQAQRNANDGISIAQTAEGSLNQINDNLQRIRELSVQAANGTNSSSDLQSIQDEIDQRLNEVNRISDETDFNGVRVLSEDAQTLSIQVGANDGQTIDVNLRTIDAAALGLDTFSVTGARQASEQNLQDIGLEEIETVDGVTEYARFENPRATASDVLALAADTDVVAVGGENYTVQASGNFERTEADVATTAAAERLTPTTGFNSITVDDGTTESTIRVDSDGNLFNESGQALNFDATDGSFAVADDDNPQSNISAVLTDLANGGGNNVESITDGNVTFEVGTASGVDVTTSFTEAEFADFVDGRAFTLDQGASGDVDFNVSADGFVTDDNGATQYVQDAVGTLDTTRGDVVDQFFVQENGTVLNADDEVVYFENDELLTDPENFATANPLEALDAALADVDSLRSELGAIQNRFEDAITNLDTNATNLSAARSRIEDADYAMEVADMTRAQILQQAGTSVLAQANQIPQNVLSLLG